MPTLKASILLLSLTAMSALGRHAAALVTTKPRSWALIIAGVIGVVAIASRRALAAGRHDLPVPPAPRRVFDRPPGDDSAGTTTGRRLSRERPMRRRQLGYFLSCGWLLVAIPGRAEEHGTFLPFVEEKVTNDDNVYRLSKDANALETIGSASTADTYHTTALGLAVDAPLRQQRLVASFTFNQTRYNHFAELNSDGRDLRASLLWQAGTKVRGEFGLSDVYSLASFAQSLSTTPDHLEARQAFANGSWMVTPQWRLRGAVDRLQQSNSDVAQQANDVAINGGEASLLFVSGGGNTIGPRVRVESAEFPYPQPLGTALIDNAYRQYALGAALDWAPSPASHLVARAEQMSRRYQQLPQRDFDGALGHLEFTWAPLDTLSVAAIAQRDTSPYELIRSSLVLVEGFGLRPAFKISSTLDLTADLETATRHYLADPVQALGLTGTRVDHVQSVAAMLSYHPTSHLTLQASLSHESRSSNVNFGDYAAQVAWLSARFTL